MHLKHAGLLYFMFSGMNRKLLMLLVSYIMAVNNCDINCAPSSHKHLLIWIVMNCCETMIIIQRQNKIWPLKIDFTPCYAYCPMKIEEDSHYQKHYSFRDNHIIIAQYMYLNQIKSKQDKILNQIRILLTFLDELKNDTVSNMTAEHIWPLPYL